MMSNEEFDRKMEFFLNQQAQFDANIQQLQEGHKRLQEAHEATEKSVDRVVEATTRAAETTGMLAESLGRLTDFVHDGFKLTFETFRNTDVKINALVDAQIETEKGCGRPMK